ncbi:MAG: carboxylating nicotinate-nucleotide diphosphorylase [Rickettsiales bacterium]
MQMPSPNDFQWLIEAALTEDIGRGDLTSRAVIDPGTQVRMRMVSREPLVVAGLEIVSQVFMTMTPEIMNMPYVAEGTRVEAGTLLFEVAGDAQIVLAAERTALNFLCRLSGIATLTSYYVEAVRGTKAVILDTRKTLPGWRALDKYAVRCGGGRNHRMRLDDGILIKDNHIGYAGGVAAALRKAKASAPSLLKIEVECDTLDQVKEAVGEGVDVILLDNMTPELLKQAVALVAGKAKLEASGGITLQNIRTVAESGVDFISIGALTHSARSVDIGLDIAPSA